MTTSNIDKFQTIKIKRLTTLWALSEALLGGILHAMKIPLTGLIIGGVATIIIIQISTLKATGREILKATFIVVLVKMILSPYTPVNAYIAVFIQGLAGSVIFSSHGFFKTRAFLFGVVVLGFSALQRLFVLTIIYGKTLWEALDIFIGIVFNQIGLQQTATEAVSYSTYIIVFYFAAHVLVGAVLGLWSCGLLNRLKKYKLPKEQLVEPVSVKKTPRFKRAWWKKPGVILIFTLSLFLYIYSIYDPQMSEQISWKPIILIVRSIAILIFWFYWFGPMLRRVAKYLLSKKENEFNTEINETLAQIPQLKILAFQCWKFSFGKSMPARIWDFIHRLPANLLLHD